ncbi:helix-turn-helix transcriptional regulator [Bifidobacterium sp. SMB2]|uniref:helix-turn-helix domain-containing protein n=1 Tax=Bifidobacterium sp. SMB2 TaxID=2661626 RepID=UPI0013D49936|nr:helix-turn-helix transcriptional regulator [Bifidobacterium sp. SMB2]
MEIIKEARSRDSRKLSLRAIEAEAGISHSRVGDLFNGKGGSPSLNEFITLCLLFGRDPADAMRTIIANLGGRQAALAACRPESDSPAPTSGTVVDADDAFIDALAADPERFGVAAHTDPNKEIESETPGE